MTIAEVPLDAKRNEELFLTEIKENLEDEKISMSEYLELLKQIPRDKPEPLAREHFYFPLGLWLAGIILSAIFLLAEIIIKSLGNKQ